MRGSDAVTGALFSYVDLEDRVPTSYPLRLIRSAILKAMASSDVPRRRVFTTKCGMPRIGF